MKRVNILAAGLIMLAALLLSACGGQSANKTAEIKVDMKEFSFNPSSVTVPASSEVKLNLTDSGTLEHSWIIMMKDKPATTPFDTGDEANIYWQTKLAAGDTQSFTFTAPSEPGEYEIVCGIPAHLEAGMKGTLIVK